MKYMRVLSRGGGEGTDVNKKYGYYLISPNIFDVIEEGKQQLWSLLTELSTVVVTAELNGRASFNKIDGAEGCVNVPITSVQLLYLTGETDNLPYCSREYFNMGIMVDESNINYSIYVKGGKFDTSYKGTLLERLKQAGDIMYYFIPITKEEYENLSNDIQN